MTKAEEDFETLEGTGNVFRDLGIPDAENEAVKSGLAAEIIKAMREQKLTHEAAARKAGVQRADISRICNVDLDRFTIDRLARIARSLDPQVHLVVARTPQQQTAARE
jgi:predicted XRE-type DNA-binding protein